LIGSHPQHRLARAGLQDVAREAPRVAAHVQQPDRGGHQGPGPAARRRGGTSGAAAAQGRRAPRHRRRTSSAARRGTPRRKSAAARTRLEATRVLIARLLLRAAARLLRCPAAAGCARRRRRRVGEGDSRSVAAAACAAAAGGAPLRCRLWAPARRDDALYSRAGVLHGELQRVHHAYDAHCEWRDATARATATCHGGAVQGAGRGGGGPARG
jgi:hypothetical protein